MKTFAKVLLEMGAQFEQLRTQFEGEKFAVKNEFDINQYLRKQVSELRDNIEKRENILLQKEQLIITLNDKIDIERNAAEGWKRKYIRLKKAVQKNY